jgi:GTPase SAR1 family protein
MKAQPEPETVLRPALAAYLAQRVASFRDGFRHNLALLGPVGSGKSWLVERLLRDGAARLTTISCCLQRDSLRDFLTRFATAVLRGSLNAPADAPLETLLEQSATVLPNTTSAIHQLKRYATGHLQAEAFAHALDLIPIVHKERQQPCVLVLDEFLHLDDLGVTHAFHELGKRVMTWPFALFVVTSSSSFRARAILRERLHLLFGQFELIDVGGVEAPAAMAWMRQAFPGAEHVAGLERFLLHWIGASPWYLSVLLKRMNELTRLAPVSRWRKQSLAVEEVLFAAAWDVLGSPDGVLHQWCAARVERLLHQRHGPLARESLIAVARGARTMQAIAQQCGMRRNLSQGLQLLIEHDLVQRKGACWIMPDQLLGCWLTAVLALNRRGGAGDRDKARQGFEDALRSAWAQWLEVATQPLAERVSRLLSRFRNETVSLDNKTGRLPSFQAINVARQQAFHREGAYLVADGDERRWCCLVHEGKLEEAGIAAFEQFCRSQSPKPSRKIVVARDGLELNAKLLAKEADMWVWEPGDMNLLFLLYGQLPLNQ